MNRSIFGTLIILLFLALASAGGAAAQDPTEAPATEAPPTEAPPTEAPPTEAPPTEAPPTVAPPTEAPPVEDPPAVQDPGMLVNAVAICPPGLTAAQIDPAACDEPGAGISFYAANPHTDNVAFGETRGDGLVSFPLDQFAIGGESGAAVEVGMILGSNPYGVVTGAAVSCEPASTGPFDSAVQPGGASLAVQYQEVIPGDQISCEWYLSHGAAADDNDDVDDAAPPVVQLPSTGAGDAADRGPNGAVLAMAVVAVALVGGFVSWLVMGRARA